MAEEAMRAHSTHNYGIDEWLPHFPSWDQGLSNSHLLPQCLQSMVELQVSRCFYCDVDIRNDIYLISGYGQLHHGSTSA